MSKSIKVASKDFPKSVLELQNLYELKNSEEEMIIRFRSNLKFY